MYTAQYDQTYSTQVLTKPLLVDVHRTIWSNNPPRFQLNLYSLMYTALDYQT